MALARRRRRATAGKRFVGGIDAKTRLEIGKVAVAHCRFFAPSMPTIKSYPAIRSKSTRQR